jgi:hypothetical protein
MITEARTEISLLRNLYRNREGQGKFWRRPAMARDPGSDEVRPSV